MITKTKRTVWTESVTGTIAAEVYPNNYRSGLSLSIIPLSSGRALATLAHLPFEKGVLVRSDIIHQDIRGSVSAAKRYLKWYVS